VPSRPLIARLSNFSLACCVEGAGFDHKEQAMSLVEWAWRGGAVAASVASLVFAGYVFGNDGEFSVGVLLWGGLPAVLFVFAHAVVAFVRSVGKRTHATFVATAWLSQLLPLLLLSHMNPFAGVIFWPLLCGIVVTLGAIVAMQLDDE
jgi:hypothetical protein